jgi:hypothetical protein
MLLPGLLVEIDGPADLQVTDLTLKRDGNETIHPMRLRQAKVRLERGTMVGCVGRSQTRSRLFIDTPAGTFSAGSGCTFKVETSEDKIPVICVRGKIHFALRKDGARLQIPAGYFADPQTVASLQPVSRSGAKGQAEVVELLKVEKKLDDLEQQKRSAFLPWR